jgi:hypothetical protein
MKGENIMHDGSLLIARIEGSDETEMIELDPYEKRNIVRGGCNLILENGSIEIESCPCDDYVNISNGFIKATYFSIRAGKTGCKVKLTRTHMQLKH